MTFRPCLVCGEPSPGTRCHEHTLPDPDRGTTTDRGYDHRWRRLSERARRLQPFCSDCGTTADLTTDHTPEAWARHERGLAVRLVDVDVLCRACNSRRGAARHRAHPRTAPPPHRPHSRIWPPDSLTIYRSINAMAEALNSLFKAELVRNKGPWRSIDDLEIAVTEYVDWYNHRRLHGEIGLIPPSEYEALHAPASQPAPREFTASTKPGT